MKNLSGQTTKIVSSSRCLKIGFSACFDHADPNRPLFKNKTLLYLEQSMMDWVMDQGGMPWMIPQASGAISIGELISEIDGLLLMGGSDVSPESYGETPLKPEWAGDRKRDLYEIELVREAMRQDKPVLGICRGIQLINVLQGGTLYQDIQTQVPGAQVHRDGNVYDGLFHEIQIEPGSGLEKLYGCLQGKINTIHHQAVKELGKDLEVEAYSIPDRIVEAFRYKGSEFVFAVQWHPEFQDRNDSSLLSPTPILNAFFKEIEKRKKK